MFLFLGSKCICHMDVILDYGDDTFISQTSNPGVLYQGKAKPRSSSHMETAQTEVRFGNILPNHL